MANPANIPNTGFLLKYKSASVNALYSASGATASFINSIPVNNIPKPISISDKCFVFWFDVNK